MADPISGPTGPRISPATNIAHLQANTKIAQAIINQLQKPAVVSVRTTAVTQSTKTANAQPATNLPRGSIVDRLV